VKFTTSYSKQKYYADLIFQFCSVDFGTSTPLNLLVLLNLENLDASRLPYSFGIIVRFLENCGLVEEKTFKIL